MGLEVIVSITTLPSRIDKIRPSIESLLLGNLVPDRIILALPETSIREKCSYKIPAFLADYRRFDVVRSDQDYGPGTKLMGALRCLPKHCYLVIADDDVSYRRDFLSGIISAQSADHAASFSYYTYRASGLTIGQGCDGFSFYAPALSGIDEFHRLHVAGTDLFFHDDLWISFFLAMRGVRVRSLAHLLGDKLIYESVHETNSLRNLTGSLQRENLNTSGVRRLLASSNIRWRARAKIATVSAYDQLVTQQISRARRWLLKHGGL